MEDIVYLDTHVLVWLYAGDLDFFGNGAKQALENNNLLISPIVLLELQYLLEIERILVSPEKIMKTLSKEIGLRECKQDFIKIILESIKIKWTRDPFDRIIAAQAICQKAPILTKDKNILENYNNAFW